MAKSDLHGNIRNRWSPYSFSERPLDTDKLKLILEAAIYAPSSFNDQPWLFVYAVRDDKESFDVFVDFLVEDNRVWAKHAGALIISFARQKISFNDKDNFYALHDTGMAVGNMLNQATALGVDMHIMGGFSRNKVRDYFNVDYDITPVAMIAVGHYGENGQLPEDVASKDDKRRGRKPYEEVVFEYRSDAPDLNIR